MNYIITKIVEESLYNKKLIESFSLLKSDKHIYPFRMYDDDGNLYYEGLSKENDSFEPLDELGYSVGCTEIHYLENRKFVRL